MLMGVATLPLQALVIRCTRESGLIKSETRPSSALTMVKRPSTVSQVSWTTSGKLTPGWSWTPIRCSASISPKSSWREILLVGVSSSALPWCASRGSSECLMEYLQVTLLRYLHHATFGLVCSVHWMIPCWVLAFWIWCPRLIRLKKISLWVSRVNIWAPASAQLTRSSPNSHHSE
jgi:hypothetical protein